MQIDNALDDRETETGAARGRAAGVIDVKALEGVLRYHVAGMPQPVSATTMIIISRAAETPDFNSPRGGVANRILRRLSSKRSIREMSPNIRVDWGVRVARTSSDFSRAASENF